MSIVSKLFEGQELSEEFKAKATTIFNEAVDAAVVEKVEALKESTVAELTASLQEDYDAKVAAKMKQLEEQTELYIQEEVLPEVDKYLTATVNEWKEENKVAIEAGAKVTLAESFLSGLVGLAESFNVSIPQSNVLDEMQAQITELTKSLQETTDKNVTLVNENLKAKKDLAIAENTVTLSATQKDKIQESLNSIEYKSDAQFAVAVKALIESTFPADIVDNVPVIVEQTKPEQKPTQSYASRLISEALR